MIRKAISCDICGTEKRQTNHWFVAYEQAGELRLGGWNSRNRLRPGAKHLCGQTCLHKLVDEFMAKSIAVRTQRGADEVDVNLPAAADASLTSAAAYEQTRTARMKPGACGVEPESSARLLTQPVPINPSLVKSGLAVCPQQPDVVTMPLPPPRVENRMENRIEDGIEDRAGNIAPLPDEPPRYASRSWHAEAWERERERELRAIENRPDIAARRHSSA